MRRFQAFFVKSKTFGECFVTKSFNSFNTFTISYINHSWDAADAAAEADDEVFELVLLEVF
jgi:hypothetical protein